MNLDNIDADLGEFHTIVVSPSMITPDELDFLARSGYVARKVDRRGMIVARKKERGI